MKSIRAEAENGFTLIELLVVVAVLAIIVAIAVVALLNALDKAKQRSTMADMRGISRAIEAYNVDVGLVPNHNGPLSDLEAVLTPHWSSVIPMTDHWGNPYMYNSDTIQYSVESYGRDGVDGADITVATRHQFDLDIVMCDGMFVAAPE